MSAVAEYTDEQADALKQLAGVLNGFAQALAACQAVGLGPSEALRAVGVDVPTMFSGTVDRLLAPPE